MTYIKNKFTWHAQYAGYNYKKIDKKGETNYTDFINEFDKFPWAAQVESYQKIQKGCSATLSVDDITNKTSFWVSVMGDIDEYSFLVGYVHPKMKKGLLGLGKKKQINWLEIFAAVDNDEVKNCFQLYFSNELDKLESKLHTMEKLDEMKAKI